MEVLICLAARSRLVVTRDDRKRKVWKNALVGHDALTGTIIKLRKAGARTVSQVPRCWRQCDGAVGSP